MTRTLLIAALALHLFAATGCRHERLTAPPEIKLGRDQCAECGMIINDDRFAGCRLVDRDDETEAELFDDVGCLLAHAAKPDAARASGVFVREFASRRWMPAEHAFAVVSDSITTPMGSGIVIYADRAAAQTRADESKGVVRIWAELAATHARPSARDGG